jgi:hypothetical protein
MVEKKCERLIQGSQSIKINGKRYGVRFSKRASGYNVIAPCWSYKEVIGTGKTRADAIRDARYQLRNMGHRQ